MKKYIVPASLFVFNNEVLSWLALLIIVSILVYNFLKEVINAL